MKSFDKEEEFLEQYSNIAEKAAEVINHEWVPNYFANDNTRRNQKYFMDRKELKDLVFISAHVEYKLGGASSTQVVLESANRDVTIRVTKSKEVLQGEVLVDKRRE